MRSLNVQKAQKRLHSTADEFKFALPVFLQLSHLHNTSQIISPDMTPQYGTEILAIRRTIRTLLRKIHKLLVDSKTPTGIWLMTPAVRYASITTVFTGIKD
jgi:hypothetical protein